MIKWPPLLFDSNLRSLACSLYLLVPPAFGQIELHLIRQDQSVKQLAGLVPQEGLRVFISDGLLILLPVAGADFT